MEPGLRLRVHNLGSVHWFQGSSNPGSCLQYCFVHITSFSGDRVYNRAAMRPGSLCRWIGESDQCAKVCGAFGHLVTWVWDPPDSQEPWMHRLQMDTPRYTTPLYN
ncbi:hypothetical protein AAY473_000359, partial [Plecturocebus cupreus]